MVKRYLFRAILSAVFLLFMIGLYVPHTVAALPAGFQEFYMPLPTGGSGSIFSPPLPNQPFNGTYSVFNAIEPTIATSPGMHYLVGVSANADNTRVYYDHWENGYGTGTGAADELISLNKGQTWKFESGAIPLEPDRGTSLKYDGGDRIYVSGGSLQVVVSTWTEDKGTVFASAWDVYPVKAWDLQYTLPVGEALASSGPNYKNFTYVFALVLSGSDNNNIVIADPVGPTNTNITLNRGQTYIYEAKGAGTTITGSAGVQVQMMTGRRTSWEMRGFTLSPPENWGTGYYTPVPSWKRPTLTHNAKSDLFIFNPNLSAITINYEDLSGKGSFSIDAGKTKSYFDGTGRYIPVDSGAYIFNTSSQVFWAGGAGDSNSQAWDWGYELVPVNFLGTDNYVSWSPGNRTLTSDTVNGSPVYVTALNDNTTVFVDYGAPNPSNPALSAINDGVFEVIYRLNRLQSIQIFDPDKDNTGMHIVSTSPVAVVWGESPDKASTVDPYLDMGYTVLPLSTEWIDIALMVDTTANPAEVNLGQESLFTVTVSVPATSESAATDVNLVDNLPAGWQYIAGSGSPADPTAITGTLAGGYRLTWNTNWSIMPGYSQTVTFRAKATASADLLNPNRNVATATGQAQDTTLSADDDAFVNITQSLSIDITRNFRWTYGNGSNAGDVVTCLYSVTNTGSAVLTNITVTDDILGPITLDATALEPAATTTGSKILEVTQALLDSGSLTSTAIASGTLPSGTAVIDTDTQTMQFPQSPSMAFIRTYNWTSGNGSNVGDIVTSLYSITNTGNVTLTDVTVTDDQLGAIKLGSTTLAPGEATTGNKNMAVTQALLDNGSQNSSAIASGTPPSGTAVTGQSSRTVSFNQYPAISIVKSFSWTTGNGSHVGDIVDYLFTVTNTGNVTLNGISVTDDKLGAIPVDSATLAPGEATTGRKTMAVTQAQLDSGSQTNTATVSGTLPGGTVVGSTDSQTIHFGTGPSISLSKSFSWTTGNGSHVGDVVTYLYSVTNTGDETLTDITVNDELGAVTLGSTTLAPGGAAAGSKTVVITQALLDSGSQSNSAIASGTPASGIAVTDADTLTVKFMQSPSIAIVKTFSWTSGNGSQVGDIVNYLYTVTNTGNVTLNSVSVTDNKLGAISLDSTTLAPGIVTTGNKNMAVTQALLDSRAQINSAIASGTPPNGTAVTGQSSQTVSFNQCPSIGVSNSFSWTAGNGSQVGDVGTYFYHLTNTGNVTLTNITVNDDKLGAITPGSTTLAPAATTTGSKTITVNQSLLDSGYQTNTVIASGTPPGGIAVSSTDSQTVHFTDEPSINVSSTFSWTTGNGSQVGDVATYLYTITNTGNATLTDITVNDDKLGAITPGSTTLASGEVTTGHKTMPVTRALLDGGYQTNITIASGTPPSGPAVTSTDTLTMQFLKSPSIAIAKTSSWTTGDGSQVGDVVTYLYSVTNTGNVTLTGVSVTDDKLGSITLGSATLSPGYFTTGHKTMAVTQALLDSMTQTNSATASGSPPNGTAVSSTDSQTVHFNSEPAIKLDRTFSWTTGNGSQVGDVVTYLYSITNTGNVTLTDITVNDDKLGAIALGTATLAPGYFTTGSKTMAVTQALLDRGSQTNIAIASGTPPSGIVVSSADSRTVSFNQYPAISLVKSFSWTKGNGSHAGDVVTYLYTVANSGNVTLTGLSITDDKLGAITPGTTSLSPGYFTTGSKDLSVTQALLDSGSETNIAIASGTPPGGIAVSSTDSQTVHFTAGPSINVSQSFSWTAGNGSHVGDIVDYLYTVTNTGNATLTNITVNDDKLGAISLGSTTLAPTATTTGRKTLAVTQNLLDSGSETNIAIASGTPPSGTAVTDTDTLVVEFLQSPSIDIVKTFNWTAGNGSHVGDVVTFLYTLANTGNVTLNGVSITDDKLGSITPGSATLASGGATTGSTTMTVTQALLDSGSETNIAMASGTSPGGIAVTDTDTIIVEFLQSPSIAIVKSFSWTTGNGSHVGDVVTYLYTVANSGNVTLNGVSVTDDKLGAITLGSATLAPGGTTTGRKTMAVNQALLDSGSQTNIALAGGTAPSGIIVSSTDSQTVHFTAGPSINVSQSYSWTTGNGSHVGDIVDYLYTVTNTGNTTLSKITVTDDILGAITPGSTTLAPAATTSGHKTMAVTQDQLDRGYQTNSATTSGTPPSGPAVTGTDTLTVEFLQSPSITIIQTCSWTTGNGSQVGDIVTYLYTLTNTGNVTLTNITVTDDNPGAITLGSTTLTPGGTISTSKDITVTQALLDSGTRNSTATAGGTPPSGPPVTDTDTLTLKFLQSPSIALVKTFSWTTGNGSKVGDIVDYLYTVTNTGNVTLNSVSVMDDKLDAIDLGSTNLAPAATATGHKNMTVTQALLDSGSQTNIAIASGTPPSGSPVSSMDSQTVHFKAGPSINLSKSHSWTTGNGSHVGDVVTFLYSVTNTGNATLTKITVNDDKVGDISLGSTTLAPGGTTTGHKTLAVTQDLLDSGSQTGIAIASGSLPSGTAVNSSDSQTVNFNQYPAISIVKTYSWTSGNGSKVGDIVDYLYTVTNTGNVTLTGVSVTDDILGAIPVGSAILAPAATTTGHKNMTVTQELLDSGSQTNTATASGTSPSGTAVTGQSSQTVFFFQHYAISVTKTADLSSVAAADSVITYTITLKNSGSQPLTDITVTDPLPDTITGPDGDANNDGKLDINETWIYTGVYTVTQTDIANNGGGDGQIDNTVRVDTHETALVTASKSVTITPSSTLILEIAADPPIVNIPGPVTYSYTVSNNGSVRLTDLVLTDDHIAVPVTLLESTLIPGASTTGTAIFNVTQAMIDSGTAITSTATITGTVNGSRLTGTRTATVTILQSPSIQIVKNGELDMTKVTPDNQANTGDKITYTFTLTNTGNVTLNNVIINDLKVNVDGGTIASLAPNEVDKSTFSATYYLTQNDINAGKVENTATVTGNRPSGGSVSDTGFKQMALVQFGEIIVTKKDDANRQRISLPGLSIRLDPNPYASAPGILIVKDNEANDTDEAAGSIRLENVADGTYVISEVMAPEGYAVNTESQIATISPLIPTYSMVFFDRKMVTVPAISYPGMAVMLSSFALLIVLSILRRRKHNHLSARD
jgi:uncharacterized repeat protein (TIGR01451 family)